MSATTREVHVGVVTDNRDPEQRGRLRVECGTLAPEGAELPDWVEPAAFPFLSSLDQQVANAGWFFVPDVGVAVELEIATQSGRDETPGMVSFDAPDVRWRACLGAGDDQIGSQFRGDAYPDRRGVQTRSGHALVFDDTKGAGSVLLASGGGMEFLLDDGALLATLALQTGDLLIKSTGTVSMEVTGVKIGSLGLDTPVIVDGLAGLQALLGASLTEIAAGLATFAVPTPNTAIVAALLTSGSFSSTLTTSE